MEKKQENNKKRSIIIVAMILLLLLLIAFCGFTFAKYITSQQVETQTATAAKWGFIVKADGTNLFKNTHTTASTADGGETITLAAATEANDNVVAPGLSGYVTFSVKGSAEVRAKISITLAENLKDITLKNSSSETTTLNYAPIQWKLYEKKSTDADFGTTALVEGTLTQVQTELAKVGVIKVGESIDKDYKLEWSWAFEKGDTDTEKATNNRYDTLIGWAANGAETYDNGNVIVTAGTDAMTVEDKATATAGTYTATTTLSLGLTISVEQVNE